MEKLKTMEEFLTLVSQTEIKEAEILIEDWKRGVGGEPDFIESGKSPITTKGILCLRGIISGFFAERLIGIYTEALYARISRAHGDFIAEFDEKARQQGFLITEPRCCISATEAMKEAGIINVTDGKVHLTRRGMEIVRQIGEEFKNGGQD